MAGASVSKLLSLDPGLARFGACGLDETGTILFADVLETAADVIPYKNPAKIDKNTGKKKRRPRKVRGGVAADTDRRLLEIAVWLRNIIGFFNPDVVVAEAFASASGIQSAIATSAANAVVTLIVGENPFAIPLVRVHSQQWRRVFVPGKRKIPDEELYDAIGRVAEQRIREELIKRGRKPNKDILVHAFDATGIGRWAVDFSAVARRALGTATPEGL